jgi:hypothetical protein
MSTKTVQGRKVVYQKSTRPDKKFMTKDPQGNTVHFGQAGSQTFLDHKDPKKRDAYQARHSAIKLKDGTRAIDKPYSPAWLSFNVLWS